MSGVTSTRSKRRSSAAAAAEERLLDLVVAALATDASGKAVLAEGRDRIRRDLREGKHESREVELEVADERTPQISVMTPQGVEEMGFDLPGLLPNLFGAPKKRKVKLPVSDARPLLVTREADALSDEATVPEEAVRRAEETGIVFLDEIDKIAGPLLARDLVDLVQKDDPRLFRAPHGLLGHGRLVGQRVGLARREKRTRVGHGQLHLLLFLRAEEIREHAREVDPHLLDALRRHDGDLRRPFVRHLELDLARFVLAVAEVAADPVPPVLQVRARSRIRTACRSGR